MNVTCSSFCARAYVKFKSSGTVVSTLILSTTVKDKSYAREKLRGFCGFSMNCKSFPYEFFEQWQHFHHR